MRKLTINLAASFLIFIVSLAVLVGFAMILAYVWNNGAGEVMDTEITLRQSIYITINIGLVMFLSILCIYAGVNGKRA